MARDTRRKTPRWLAFPWLVLCLAALSISAGGNWSIALDLSASPSHTEDASIAVDSSGRIHAVWSEGGEVLHRLDAGGGWSAPSHVASGTSPDLAADAAGRVHLVFANRFADSDDIYFMSWLPAGGWGLPVNLSEGVGVSSSPRVAIGPDHSFAVVWSARSAESEFIYVARSADGLLWSMLPIPHAHGTHPVVALTSSANLLVAWQGPYDDVGSPSEIFLSQQTGSQWTLPVDVSASPELNSCLPWLSTGQGEAYVAWQEAGPWGQAVCLSGTTNGQWNMPQKRSGSDQAFAPAMGLDRAGDGHVVWTTGSAIQHTTWSPSTGIWQPIEDVCVGQIGPRGARIALQGSLHVIWLAQASTDNDDVYYSTRPAVEPSPTPSATETATATPTRVVSATPTSTATATPLLSPPWRLVLPCILMNSQPMP